MSHTENSTIATIRDHKPVGVWLGDRLTNCSALVASEDGAKLVEPTVHAVAAELYAQRASLGIAKHLAEVGGRSAQLSALREVVRSTIVEIRELALEPA